MYTIKIGVWLQTQIELVSRGYLHTPYEGFPQNIFKAES